jgi:hypothetical protein
MPPSFGSFLPVFVVAAGICAVECAPVKAALVYGTSVGYLTGQDPYAAQSIGSTGEVFGTATASLDYSGSGPLGGTFDYSGAAEAANLALKTRAAVTLTNYTVGSYFLVDTPAYDYLPISGTARSSVTDQITISGPNAAYSVDFVYRLTGTAARGEGNFDSYFRPLLAASVSFYSVATGNSVGAAGTALYPENGLYDSIVTLTAQNIPSNALLSLTQFLQVLLYSADSMYSTDNNPYQDGDWDPSHITFETTLVDNSSPYSVNFSADFSHTLELQNVVLRHLDGSLAAEASLLSENGVLYPGQMSPVPEPATWAVFGSALALLPILRRMRHRGKRG